MQLRNITNEDYPSSVGFGGHRIVHELNNQGCRCNLCQKIVINENKIIKQVSFTDQESEHTKGKKEDFLLPFLLDIYSLDKLPRKVRYLLPQICIFEKGTPVTLLTKKRETAPIKIIKNKQKLNAFQIQNFFTDGYITHNSINENEHEIGKFKSVSRQQYYNYRDILKNDCIVLAKFENNTFQMMSLTQLTNLFKSKQRNTRSQILYISTLVNAKDHNEIRVHIDLQNMKGPLFERAKTEVKIINQDIKQKDFMYVSQKDEKIYEQLLKEKDRKTYLQYLSLKLILLYSLKTDILMESCLFKFIKGEGDYYYLNDLQLYKKSKATRIWGELGAVIQQKNSSPSPNKKRQRPTSSPERLQSIKPQSIKIEENREDRSVSYKLMKQSQKVKQMIRERVKTSSLFKLQPIINPKLLKQK